MYKSRVWCSIILNKLTAFCTIEMALIGKFFWENSNGKNLFV